MLPRVKPLRARRRPLGGSASVEFSASPTSSEPVEGFSHCRGWWIAQVHRWRFQREVTPSVPQKASGIERWVTGYGIQLFVGMTSLMTSRVSGRPCSRKPVEWGARAASTRIETCIPVFDTAAGGPFTQRVGRERPTHPTGTPPLSARRPAGGRCSLRTIRRSTGGLLRARWNRSTRRRRAWRHPAASVVCRRVLWCPIRWCR